MLENTIVDSTRGSQFARILLKLRQKKSTLPPPPPPPPINVGYRENRSLAMSTTNDSEQH